MSFYEPDVWTLLRIKPKDGTPGHFRVFAGWYGGFAGSDAWKMNSGITKIIDGDGYWDFRGESGSTYRCAKEPGQRMSGYMMQIFTSFKKQQGHEIDLDEVDLKDLPENLKC